MLFAVTALLSAFLLFLVQPLMGRYVLPWFGGGSTVWTICMLFFQSGLLAGYAYAHLLALRLPARRGVAVHLGLAALSLLALPIIPSPPEPGGSPTLGILATLGLAVAGPYLVLASTAPLVQAWAVGVERGRSPYRLYAWSNAGSLAALVAYPALLEPLFGLRLQAWSWSALYGLFAALIALCGWRVWREGLPLGAAPETRGPPPPIGDRALWIALTATASALLLATTDRLTEDISASPFLWVLPLGLYLLTFIICFGRPAWADRRVWFGLLPLAGFGLWWAIEQGADLGIPAQLAILDGALFIGCMALHGEVVRLRPAPGHLTGFYLATALGGAIGGVLVGLVAPALLPIRLELQIAALATGLLASVQAWRAWTARPFASAPRWIGALMPLMVLALAVGFALDVELRLAGVSAVDRGFYGVLRVKEMPAGLPTGPARKLVHGRIMHGQQYTDARSGRPLSYYADDSGIGRLFAWGAEHPARSVAAVGLGVGTIAAFGRQNDRVVFYEIDPLVERFAEQWFTYLGDARARGADVEVVIGDGRLQLARATERYDVIVLDAFSSDAIPAHLLTREAFDLYLDRLTPDGLLVINIANRHLDLRPVIRAHVHALGLRSAEVARAGDWLNNIAHTRWVFVARRSAFIDHLIAEDLDTGKMALDDRLEWTDDFAPLLPLLKAFH